MQYVIQNQKLKSLGWLAILLFAFTLTGCGAMHTMIKKRNLDVQTKMSETIFLEPSKPSQRIIYVSIRNTSDKQLDIKKQILGELMASGFKITKDPDKARYMLQANVLQCGKADLRAATDAYRAGFGGAIVGMTAAHVGGANSSRSMAGAGLLGAIAGVAGDALVDDTLYSMITDLQVRERPMKGEVITQSQRTNAKQGTATTMKQTVTGGKIKWKTYRTRILSTANKANLEFAEAKPVLEDGLRRSIAGIFAE